MDTSYPNDAEGINDSLTQSVSDETLYNIAPCEVSRDLRASDGVVRLMNEHGTGTQDGRLYGRRRVPSQAGVQASQVNPQRSWTSNALILGSGIRVQSCLQKRSSRDRWGLILPTAGRTLNPSACPLTPVML